MLPVIRFSIDTIRNVAQSPCDRLQNQILMKNSQDVQVERPLIFAQQKNTKQLVVFEQIKELRSFFCTAIQLSYNDSKIDGASAFS